MPRDFFEVVKRLKLVCEGVLLSTKYSHNSDIEDHLQIEGVMQREFYFKELLKIIFDIIKALKATKELDTLLVDSMSA